MPHQDLLSYRERFLPLLRIRHRLVLRNVLSVSGWWLSLIHLPRFCNQRLLLIHRFAIFTLPNLLKSTLFNYRSDSFDSNLLNSTSLLNLTSLLNSSSTSFKYRSESFDETVTRFLYSRLLLEQQCHQFNHDGLHFTLHIFTLLRYFSRLHSRLLALVKAQQIVEHELSDIGRLLAVKPLKKLTKHWIGPLPDP
jgi:hypothetical protein